MTKKGYILALLALLLLSSCRGKGGHEPSAPVTSIAFETQWTPLRATLINVPNDVDSFSASAFIYRGTWAGTSTSMEPYFTNITVTNDGGVYDTGYPWLGGGDRKFAFSALAPAGIPASQIQLSGNILTYTVPTDLSAQVDLMSAFASDIPVDQGTPVDLTFKHLLSAVEFTVDSKFPSATIKSLTVKGIHSKAIKILTEDLPWLTPQIPADYIVLSDGTLAHTNGTDTSINGTSPLMLMPQSFPGGAEIELVMVLPDASNTEVTYRIDISTHEIVMGKKYHVRLTPSGITLGGQVLPWDVVSQRVGFIPPEDVYVFDTPHWEILHENGSVTETQDRVVYLDPTDQKATLILKFLQPIGVQWRATLSNGYEFSFPPGADISGGITSPDTEIRIGILPKYPAGDRERRTGVYFTLYDEEIDPDNVLGEEPGPVGRGKGNRYTVVQRVNN